MKHKVVIFNDDGNRLLTVDDDTPYLTQENTLVDPDMTPIKGVPPHFWYKKDKNSLGVKPNDEGYNEYVPVEVKIKNEVLETIGKLSEQVIQNHKILQKISFDTDMIQRACRRIFEKERSEILPWVISSSVLSLLALVVTVLIHYHVLK